MNTISNSSGLDGARFEDMKQPTSQILYAYWNGVRADRMAPRRFEIEPSRIAGILPDTFILERCEDQAARFRLAGTRICDAFGAEFRGVDFFALFSAEDRITLQRQFNVIARQGAAGVFVIEAVSPSGASAVFEMCLLPLVHTNDAVDRFLGAMSPEKAYPWLNQEPLKVTRLLSHDLIWPEGRPHAAVEAVNRQVPFLPHVRNARIVRSNRRQFRVYEGGLSKTDEDR
jgi:hypothetical protein